MGVGGKGGIVQHWLVQKKAAVCLVNGWIEWRAEAAENMRRVFIGQGGVAGV